MMDPKGLVYSGQDNSGAAAIFTGSADLNLFYRNRDRKKAEEKAADAQAARLANEAGDSMGTAWDIDLPELKQQYYKVVGKLKEYEGEKNEKRKRDLWYEAEEARTELRNQVNKSAKNRQAYMALSNRMSSDDKWRYSDDDYTTLETWKKSSLKDRTDFPEIQAANTQSALQALIKSTQYKPDVVTDKWTNEDGTGGSTTRTLIDEGELKESVLAALPTLPQNMQYALKADQRARFLQMNPGVLSLPYDQQETMFNDYLSQQAVSAILPGISKKTVTVTNKKKARQGDGSGGGGGGGGYVNANGIWDVTRISGDEQYFISVQPNSKSGVKAPLADKITITGAEYKKLTGFNTVGATGEKVEDDKLYSIDGIIDGVVLSPGQKPVLRIRPIDILTGKLKQGSVKDVVLSSYNEQILLKYGANWREVFWQLKDAADQKWNKAVKSTGAPTTSKPGETPSKGRAAGPTGGTGSGAGKAPSPSQSNYAPAGWPASDKPFKKMTPAEQSEYKKKLTDKQKLQFITETRRRNAN